MDTQYNMIYIHRDVSMPLKTIDWILPVPNKHLVDSGGNYRQTPFLKNYDGKRDSQTILACENLFIRRYEPRTNDLKL